MPAPCKQCGFVGSAEEMKAHMYEQHGARKPSDWKPPNTSRPIQIAKLPNKSQVENDLYNRILEGMISRRLNKGLLKGKLTMRGVKKKRR